ncbi:TIGR03083 family protein [Actinopolyspora mzabensis]|uniref:TIGR03083 family protein n=1 Tax=Actinopolyspora mzabensis TaxID=995066 RepID=A0A1G8Y360_ACTMZ|nr:maleylpyruvate isomerase N-terminal domain-containing protein [Actinopolyspora mzabensis]SDJ97221.1 TIGR03083 family protein [Actinopolyspora mzabensis]
MNYATQEHDNETLYREVRRNISQLVRSFPEACDRVVPSCPDWTVRDLISHLVDICGLVIERISGDTPHLASKDTDDITRLMGIWESVGTQVENMMRDDHGNSALMVMDAFTHELDLHHALGTSPREDHPAFFRSFEVLVSGVSESVAEHELPAVIVQLERREWKLGNGEPRNTVTGGHYDLYRSFAGRRSNRQINALSWGSDPVSWLPAFTWKAFSPPVVDVEPHPSGWTFR